MSKIKDFKSIADGIMSDINVSGELREKTLRQCMKKSHVFPGKLLVPAACFILILGIIKTSGILPLKTQIDDERNPEINIMSDTGKGLTTLPEQSGNNITPDTAADKTWLLETWDEAKESFGSSFLMPTYIPESFKLDKIHASGSDEYTSNKVILSYFAGEQSFLIIEEKNVMQNELVDYRSIDFNGTKGYLKSGESEESDGSKSADSLDTELHWFGDETHYLIIGQITENEAIKIAKSMN